MVLTIKLGKRCFMEDNQKPAEENIQATDTESEQLSREKILAISREENKNGDEKEKQFYVKANSIALSAGLLVAGILMIISVAVQDRFPIEIVLITVTMQAVQSFGVAYGVRKARKLYLIVGICEAVAGVILLVLWILQMCGIML